MSSPCFAVASPWTDLAAVYRRWAFLRALGRASEAAAFARDQWEPSLNAARADGLDEADLAALTHAEDDRLATATLIADLIAARAPATPAVAPAPSSALTRSSAAPSSLVSPPSSGAQRRPADPNDINIADLIDSMLANQRPTPAT